ncbi:efflux RND transporter periplasmic adaptor subunit [Rhodovastum atsumiense]|uniref:Efflux RND transporter periplasmic adaptor subunit n=2 Tax=Rhodovastum atsumiense TaxID=504468 RepID=A0A5M6IYV0_9PROT|nr:efflux RND transporter periplasmic adaptor subunit [Rhodovastum atsumiense]
MLALAGCKEQQTQAHGAAAQGPAPVGVVTLQSQPVSITTDLPGRTNAYQVADVRPQVGGIVQSRLFTEGRDVKAGQQLYQIDPAPYRASLASARATLAKAEASVTSARLTVNRYRPLAQARAVSPLDYDNAMATLREAEADVASAQAAVQTAQINLDYTRMMAPISGRTSRSSVTPGALVTASQTTTLVTITQLDPIYVDVTQPSSVLLRLRREWAAGQLRRSGEDQAPVKLFLEDGSEYPHVGRLQFSEVSVDQGTGSVTLRLVFPNPDALLLPGMFVRAQIEEGVNDHALLVPQQAVTRNTQGEATALVVDQDQKVAQRILKVDRSIGNAWLVTSGLAAGDKVIVDGVQRIRPGAQVTPQDVAASKAASASAAPATR